MSRARAGPLLWSLLAAAALGAAQSGRTFTGTITDSECARAEHAGMRMGSNDAECAAACVSAHGATWMLYDGKATYGLSDQSAPEKFAGQRVTVTGTLDARSRTITVESIAAAR